MDSLVYRDRIAEAESHIDLCLFDLVDRTASIKRKRRAKEWLGYWATEHERIVDAMSKQA